MMMFRLSIRKLFPNRRSGNCRYALLMIVVAALGLGAAEALAQRKRQVSQMSPSEKQQLLDNHQRFLALAPEERDRLRELDRAIVADENAEQLRDVMQRYHDWLMANLSPTERARLLQLESEERIAQIQRRLENQTRRQENELSDEDIETIVDWVERRMRARVAACDRGAAVGAQPQRSATGHPFAVLAPGGDAGPITARHAERRRTPLLGPITQSSGSQDSGVGWWADRQTAVD